MKNSVAITHGGTPPVRLAASPQPTPLSRGSSRSCQDPVLGFSSLEERVLSCLAEGLLYKEIVDLLGLSMSRLRKLQRRIFRKTHGRNRTEAVNRWQGKFQSRRPAQETPSYHR